MSQLTSRIPPISKGRRKISPRPKKGLHMTGSQLTKQNGYASKQIIIHNWHCFKKNCTKTVGLLPFNMERLPTKQDGRNRTGGVQNASNDGDSWIPGHFQQQQRSLVSIYLAKTQPGMVIKVSVGWRAWNLNHISNSYKQCTKDWIVEHPPSPCKSNKIQLQSVTIISIYRYILSASSINVDLRFDPWIKLTKPPN